MSQEDWDDDDHRPGSAPEARLPQGRDPVYARTHGYLKRDTAAQRINAAVGLKITVLEGTMWAAYLFAIIAFVSLPSTIKQHSATVIVLWLSSEFIQSRAADIEDAINAKAAPATGGAAS